MFWRETLAHVVNASSIGRWDHTTNHSNDRTSADQSRHRAYTPSLIDTRCDLIGLRVAHFSMLPIFATRAKFFMS